MHNNKLIHPKARAHGEIHKIFDNIWFVQGGVKMPMLMPIVISHSMTILKDPLTDELSLINAMRLSDVGLKSLENIGKVTNIIRIAGFHGKDDGFYREKYGAKIYAIQGQAYSRKLDNKTKVEDGYLQPDVWLGHATTLPINAASLKIFKSCNPPEAVLLLDQDNGILITGDSLQNTPVADKFVNFPARYMMKKMGFYQPYLVGAGWLQYAKPDPEEVRSILDLSFEHVLPGHGNPVINEAKEKYKPAINGELKGCHPK